MCEETKITDKGLKEMGSQIGGGFAWMGFWIFLGLSSIEVVQQVSG